MHIVDDVFDLLEDAAFNYLDLSLNEEIEFECARVAELNLRMCEMLSITFQANCAEGGMIVLTSHHDIGLHDALVQRIYLS